MMRTLLVVPLAAVLALCGEASAQVGVESAGERSQVMSCFYECKAEPPLRTLREVTTLMLVNQNAALSTTVTIAFLNGNEEILSFATTELTPGDLDELNVCRTIDNVTPDQAFAPVVPSAGLIEVIDPGSVGVYGWVKNLLGRFSPDENEPFNGRVDAIAKTECRLVPPAVATAAQVLGKITAAEAVPVTPILIEGTNP